MFFTLRVVSVCCLLFPVVSLAFVTEQLQSSQPYETLVITTPPQEARAYLGELKDYPDMYEITSTEPFTLQATIRQPLTTDAPVPFSLILVRQDDRGGGVSEVARLRHADGAWNQVADRLVAFTYLESETVSVPVEAGTYRIEISTPENLGRYWLHIGAEAYSEGYFATLGHIWAVQRHFAVGWWRFLWSSHVFYPVGSLVLVLGMWLTWRFRRSWLHVA